MFNESAITLGKIQVEFECLFGNKKRRLKPHLTTQELAGELWRMCSREQLPYKCFQYLEKYLITEEC